MFKKISILTIGLALLVFGCNTKPDSIQFTLENPTTLERIDETVSINLEEVNIDFNNFIVKDGENIIPYQVSGNELIFNVSLSSKETRTFQILPSTNEKMDFVNRVQAELSVKQGGVWEDRKYIGGNFKNIQALRVPDEHTDHSFYIRYEGPGWESDKVGYRFYLDWRNAIDIFGKKTSDLVLHNVGQDGFDSYHEIADWGMDILKVGSSLGIGSMGMLYDGSLNRVEKTDSIYSIIEENGPIRAKLNTKYFGWEVGNKSFDLSSTISISAGTRLTHNVIKLSNNPENFVTGIVKHPEVTYLKIIPKSGDWACLATYGPQSLAGDDLGMAIFFKRSNLVNTNEDDLNYFVELSPLSGEIDYYFAAAWEGEKDGIGNQREFQGYLNETLQKLNNPIRVKF